MKIKYSVGFLIFILVTSTPAFSDEKNPVATSTKPLPAETNKSESHGAANVPLNSAANGVEEKPFLEKFQNLKEFVYEEPKSGFFLGAGVSPVGISPNRFLFTFEFFQLHWMSPSTDFEIFNASYMVSQAQSPMQQVTAFTLRMAPKYRFSDFFSAGPLIGYEFVSFTNVAAKLISTGSPVYETPNFEPFSNGGLIYGLALSQTLKRSDTTIYKINEVAYQESYSTTQTPQGWLYYYSDPSLRTNPAQIGAGYVFMVDFSILY